MPYERQVLIKIRSDTGNDVITNGANALGRKAATQKDCQSIEVEWIPRTNGDPQMSDNWQEAIAFMKTDDPYNRIYILTHGSALSPGTLQGLNAAEVARLLLPFKGYVRQITLVVCRGGATAEGGVNFAQQLADRLIGFNAKVSAYTVPVAIWTQQLIEKYGLPQSLGKKFADYQGKDQWIRDHSSGVTKTLPVKQDFPTRAAVDLDDGF